MKTSTDPRHLHRIKIVQHLFSAAYQNKPDDVVIHIWKDLAIIDPVIVKAAPEWPLNKLNPVDLAILRLAVHEMLVDKQTPYKVIIDEAVEIAKSFGGTNSSAFINGALGKVVEEHEPSA
jgi:N utilization substance protein B